MIRLIRRMSILLFAAALLVYLGSSYYLDSRSDTNGPVITMGSDTITVSVHATEEELLDGITARDEKDGDVTSSLLVEKMGVFAIKGQRQITVAAFDSHGNVTKKQRTICYSDYESPRVSVTEPLRIPVNSTTSLINYIRAEDCLDGNITDSVQITQNGKTVTSSMPGEYPMKIMVSNSVGDLVEIPVTVEIYDYSRENLRPAPLLTEYLIYLPAGSKFRAESYLEGIKLRGKEYIWAKLDAEDKQPEILKEDIRISDPVDTDEPGVYEVTYTAEDEDGNEGKVRLIVIVTEE